MHKPLALLLTLTLALPAFGADKDARAKTIAPYLDEQTIAVARLDVTKLDGGAVTALLTDLGGAPADDAADVKARAGRWLAAFGKAGGKEVFVVFSLADFPDYPFVLVPLGEGADAKALAGLLDLPGVPAGPREKVGDNVLFAGSAAARQRLRSLKPAERPELAMAFSASGDGALQVALAPPPHLGRVLDEMLPVLPKEVGGGSSKVLAHGVKWAALGLDAAPKVTLRLTVQAANADSARALNDGILKAMKALGEQKEVVAALPKFDKMAAVLVPKVEEDRVVLTLEGEDARAGVAPLVRYTLAAVARGEALDRLKQLAVGMHYHVDARGHMPAVANFDKAGKPLLSWRVHMLPYVEQDALFKEFHLDEPWDSEHNKKLLPKMPTVYRSANKKLNEQGKTVFLAPTGKGTAWPGTTGLKYPASFLDGTSNTILFVLADDARAVEWTKPEDLKIDPDKPHAGLGQRGGKFLVGLADGSVRGLKPTISKETLWGAFTPSGGEVLGEDW
jgi:hypothetical protein